MKHHIRLLVVVLLALLAQGAVAQVSFNGSYIQDFDAMGTTGTAPPAGWSFFGALGGSNGTWTNATGIPAGSVGGGTLNNALAATTSFAASSNTAGFNYALPASTGDRAIGTSPTSGQGLVWQLALTNGTGSAINAVRIRYDIRRFTAPAANQLPGYWLFYSADGGTTWQNVAALNPTLTGPAGVIVPGTTGVTTVPATAVSLAGSWGAGTQLLLRWVDDNATETSPDQILGLDNVVIDLPIGQPPTAAITSPADGSAYAAGSTIHFAAAASDTDGSIAKVEFFEGATKLGEDATAPYEFAWTGVAAGSYGITARATDNSGNTTSSAPIAVTVSAGPGGTLTRGPYLQKAAPDRMTIRWRSSQAVAGRVSYGTSAGSLTFTMDESGATTEHVVELAGLSAGTTYYYSVGSASDTLASGVDHVFTTPPVAGSAVSTRVWVLGDAGTATANQTAVRDAFYTWTGARTPSLVLQLGDNAYNTGTDAEFQAAVFNMYGTMLRKTPFWSCLGNHETAQSNGVRGHVSVFRHLHLSDGGRMRRRGVGHGALLLVRLREHSLHQPRLDDGEPLAGGRDGDVASERSSEHHCDVDRVLLPPPALYERLARFRQRGRQRRSDGRDAAEHPAHPRGRWRGPRAERPQPLLRALVSARWALRHLHHAHGCDEEERRRRAPGGNGAYIKPLTGPRDHFGAVYSVAGSAGQATGGSLNHPAHFISLNNLGSLVLDVNGTTLTGTFVRENVTVPDTFTIIKQGAADSDGDGVADAFETANGMNRFDPADAVLDADGDGNTALAEYLFGLNPHVSDRYGWAATRNQTTGFHEVTFPTLPQRVYQVLWSDDLLSWHPGSAEVSGDGTTKLWIDDGTVTGSLPSAAPRRFYRVQVKNGP